MGEMRNSSRELNLIRVAEEIKRAGIIFLFSAISLCATWSYLYAQTVSTESAISTYEQYAFPGSTTHLVRPTSGKSTNLKIHCLSSVSCKDKITLLNTYLRANWISAIEVNEFDPNEVLSVELNTTPVLGQNDLESQIVEKLNIPVGTDEKVFAESTTPNCKAASLVSGREIKMVVVLAYLGGSDTKLVSCILLQLARGVGLNFPTFTEAWAGNGALAALTDNDIDRFMHGTARLIAMHTISSSSVGLTKSELEEALRNKTLPELIGE